MPQPTQTPAHPFDTSQHNIATPIMYIVNPTDKGRKIVVPTGSPNCGISQRISVPVVERQEIGLPCTPTSVLQKVNGVHHQNELIPKVHSLRLFGLEALLLWRVLELES